MVISKKTIIFQGFRGGPTFSRGPKNFPGGGSNANFYRNPYNFFKDILARSGILFVKT